MEVVFVVREECLIIVIRHIEIVSKGHHLFIAKIVASMVLKEDRLIFMEDIKIEIVNVDINKVLHHLITNDNFLKEILEIIIEEILEEIFDQILEVIIEIAIKEEIFKETIDLIIILILKDLIIIIIDLMMDLIINPSEDKIETIILVIKETHKMIFK